MDEQELLKRLRQAFQEESAERLNIITTRLVDLENADGKNRQDVLEDIYREAHSLKGAARAVNLLDIENVCQAVESVFGALKTNKIDLDTALFDIFHKTIEIIENLLAHPDQEADPETDRFIEQLSAIKSGKPAADFADAAPAPREPEIKPPAEPDSHEIKQQPDETVSDNADPLSELPDDISLKKTDSENTSAEIEPEAAWSVPANDREPASMKADPVEEPAPATQLEKSLKTTSVRIKTDKLDMLLRKAEEMISLKLVNEEQLLDIQQIKNAWGAIQELLSDEDTGKQSVEHFISLNMEAFSNIRHGFNNLLQSADRNKRFVAGMVDDLLDSMKDITMLPFTTLTNFLPRMVRDIARQQNKDIELKMTGTDIEIDRRILEEMKDPLVHLVRNAIDHGIETKEERSAKSKSVKARLTLNIQQREGGNVEMMLSDNGRGMDPEKLRKTAVKKGLISQQDADMLTMQQCFNLVFLSGMSTSPIITEISGRGLGMAIVKESIEQLGGSISMNSQKGIGTVFEIDLPVSLATFRGVLIAAGDRKFMVSSNLVDTVIKIGSDQVTTIENKTAIPFENRSLPIVELAQILSLNSSPLETVDEDYKIIVLGSGENKIGFKVDDVICEQEILVKGLGKQLVRVRHIAGATILGSGEVVPVLNVRDLISTAVQHGQGLAFNRQNTDQDEEEQKSVLIAEDSITSRMLLKSILESAGYTVNAAVDGLDALTKLKNQPADLVVSDVEMPRMNGFELTKQINQNQRLKEIPVVLCTSLASDEDKARGVEAGATAYIVKSNFDQTNLLQVINRLL